VLRDSPPIPVGISNTGNKGSLPAEIDVEAIDGHGEGGGGAVWEEEGRGGGGGEKKERKSGKREG